MGKKNSKYNNFDENGGMPVTDDDDDKTDELEDQTELIDDLSSHTHWTPAQVKTLLNTFRETRVFADGIDMAQFGELFNLRDDMLEKCFNIFDVKKTGLIDAREFIVGLSVAAKGSQEEKFELLFDLFDKDDDGSITQEELKTMFRCSVGTVLKMARRLFDGFEDALDALDNLLQEMEETGTANTETRREAAFQEAMANLPLNAETVIEMCVDEIFTEGDTAGDGVLSKDEFMSWAQRNVHITEFMGHFVTPLASQEGMDELQTQMTS